MAEKLNVLKARIKAVTSTHKITKTMDMIARSRTAKILTVEQGMRPFTQKLNRIVEDLSHSDMDHVHPLLAPKKKIKNIILFVVTSSRGLCGSYNTKIFDEAMERIRHHHRHGREVQLHVLGKKGEAYFEKQGIKVFLNHKAQKILPEKKCVIINDKEVSYDELVICTGAKPNIPNIKNIDMNGVYFLRRVSDGIKIKEAMQNAKRAIIVGGGYIGIELLEDLIHSQHLLSYRNGDRIPEFTLGNTVTVLFHLFNLS